MSDNAQSPSSPRTIVSTNVERGGDRSPPPAFRNGMPPALIAILVTFGIAIVAVIVSIALFRPPS